VNQVSLIREKFHKLSCEAGRVRLNFVTVGRLEAGFAASSSGLQPANGSVKNAKKRLTAGFQ